MTEAEQEALWQAYVAAKHKAEQSEKLEDGIAAGKAYGRFVASYVDRPDNVVPLRGRA